MNHDVAIVGGGLVGLTLACALGEAGVRVAVIEAREAQAHSRGEDFDIRTSAITPVSQRILAALGIWQQLPAERVGVFEDMRVWDQAGRGEVHFAAADADLPVLGHIIENRELVQALEVRAASLETVRMYRPARLVALQAGPHRIALELDASRLEARLLAAADGATSQARALSGIDADVRPYEQHAVVATVRSTLSHQHTAWQRFLPNGPLAFLPLPDNFSSVVWSTTAEQASALAQMDKGAFAQALSDAYEGRLGAIETVTARGAFPLTRVKAHRYLAPRVALLGDAAHTIHPLAGQGVNLGLLDAAVLAERVIDLLDSGRDPGLQGNLRPYERSRRGHNLLTGELMTAFNAVFGARNAPVGVVRNLGLGLANRLPLLRRACIHYASGFAFDLPALAASTRRV